MRFDGLSILVVEDELLLRKRICANLEGSGADVTGAETLKAAGTWLKDMGADFVLLDINLPDGIGTDLLSDECARDANIIVMTAYGSIEQAVESMRRGAVDYISKPFDAEELPLVISRALQAKHSARIDEHRNTDIRSSTEFFFGAALKPLKSNLEKIIQSDKRLQTDLPPVLLSGETGTGKTSIARWIHYNGPRADKPIVEVNCSALPEALAESELFGHERGAFTDARTSRIGLFEAAKGGSLFLDELPSLSPPLQAKVLTAIEEKRVRRLGGNKYIPVDARVIAATNQDLNRAMAEGRFREDLFHRLNLFAINIPPLRERGNDIASLAELFLKRLCKRHKLPPKRITPLGKRNLISHHWPGNVRELAHELERAVVFEDSNTLDFNNLAPSAAPAKSRTRETNDWFNEEFIFPESGFSMEDAINRIINHALEQTDNNVSAAARLLGVSRDYIRYRLEQPKK
ncbi:MAG: sigma-54 dependent transcriptional regulator [Verrucomicrobia bacterium]|nr:sigma-54 dependent transcriptional regulator [Verrucomicrobiota bacterium]